MMKSIQINNFKSIKSKYFPFRNLNILLGLNGMGKSSLIQNLLAFRQSKKIEEGRFDLIGDYVKIGTTKDALYQYSKNTHFATKLKFTDGQEIDYSFDYKIDADFFTAINIDNTDIENRIYNRNIRIKNIDLENKIYKRIYRTNNIDLQNRIYNKNPRILNYSLENIKYKRNIRKLESLFNDNFQYLNANRIEPQSINLKNYSQVVELKNIGIHGEYTAHFIETFGNDEIMIDALIHPNSNVKDEITGDELIVKTLINQINLWMGEISPNVNIRTTSFSSDNVLLEYSYKQPNYGYTNRFKPENVGFGITYSLPVIVAILKSKPGDLLIIENPESHIHPKGQAVLGKLIALASKSGVQIIIETHSDHFINGIRVAVKEEDINKDQVIIFYFEKVVESNEQYSRITNVEIDQNGELSEYPKDMLDEWSDQLMKLL